MSSVDHPALHQQPLAFNAISCRLAKQLLKRCTLPSNEVEEGVTYTGDAEGTVHYRLYYPAASSVVVEIPGSAVALSKSPEGVWTGTGCYPVGLQCVMILLDGQDVCTPYLPLTLNHGRPMNYIDVPAADSGSGFYAMRNGREHGSIANDFFASTIQKTTEKLLIYTPPSYRKPESATRRYPVLYLLCGMGENENGWVYNGKLNIIADNLIADGKMVDMIIVMGNGMVVRKDASVDFLAHVEELVKDIIPYVDNNYRTKVEREHRAVAGLSMGSMQASCASLKYPNLFSAVGIFSGFLQSRWAEDKEGEDEHIQELRKDPASYRKAMKLIYRGMGNTDPFKCIFDADSKILDDLGVVEDVRKIYHGAHCWQVWRESIFDLLPLLFKP